MHCSSACSCVPIAGQPARLQNTTSSCCSRHRLASTTGDACFLAKLLQAALGATSACSAQVGVSQSTGVSLYASGNALNGGCGYVTMASREQAAAALAAVQAGSAATSQLSSLTAAWAPSGERHQQPPAASGQSALAANAGRTVSASLWRKVALRNPAVDVVGCVACMQCKQCQWLTRRVRIVLVTAACSVPAGVVTPLLSRLLLKYRSLQSCTAVRLSVCRCFCQGAAKRSSERG